VWLNATATLPASQISCVIPNVSLSGPYSSMLKLTNPGNITFGSGSGLTNISLTRIAGGVTTRIVIGGHTFYYTNRIG
jgi:hypothetical protein